jgi:NTE family protein
MFGRFRRTEEVIGFALSGGGARAASQVGTLKALTESGIAPQVVAGTSAGAINAAWFSLHPSRLDRLEAIWLGLRGQDVFPGSRLRMLINLARHGYVHRADSLEAYLRRHVGTAHFEDASIPFAVVALRLSDGQRVVFDSGEVVPAVMASAAIPGVFPPYRIGDELYVDGGLVEYLPVPTLLERNATTVWALDCSAFSISAGPYRSVVDRCGLIGSSKDVMYVTSLLTTRGCKVHLLRPDLPEIGDARDFGRTPDLVLAGYEHARSYLREALRARSGAAPVDPGHTAS